MIEAGKADLRVCERVTGMDIGQSEEDEAQAMVSAITTLELNFERLSLLVDIGENGSRYIKMESICFEPLTLKELEFIEG
ncbi:hypothetical protein BGZ65_007772 [Modicella reniformis]|uniref:Uncharacterized protein n=1 Tax=Modicella reniformis TaxID=1440133 RepID=A0A9P6J5G0_9FUNG|nr:hypothetical protein BGZ65_007772 [Modicella reniformis]